MSTTLLSSYETYNAEVSAKDLTFTSNCISTDVKAPKTPPELFTLQLT